MKNKESTGTVDFFAFYWQHLKQKDLLLQASLFV